MTNAVHPNTFAVLTATPATLRALLADYSEAELRAPVDDGWSVRHCVAHILDVDDVIGTGRIARIVAEDRPFIRSIDPAARMNERGLLDRDVASLLDELARTRPGRVAAVAALTATDLGREGAHDEAGTISVSDLIHQWAYHDLMHIQQALTILQSPFVERMGNTRKFYDL